VVRRGAHINIEDRLGAGDRRQGRVGYERAQEPCESLIEGGVSCAGVIGARRESST
jgi:hypothetical protein